MTGFGLGTQKVLSEADEKGKQNAIDGLKRGGLRAETVPSFAVDGIAAGGWGALSVADWV